MENDNNQKPKNEAAEKAIAKLEAVRAVKKLSNGDSPWTIPQEILQEIMASHTVANPDKQPPLTQMTEELKKEIEARYADDEELKTLLLNSVPDVRAIRVWVKKDGWDEAVWGKVRGDRLFSADKRAQVIESLRLRAIDKSDVAAKIWLTLSGDYSEKMEVDNKTVDTYREINNIIHRKKNDSE
jgi:hypothetical protein